MTSQGLRLPNTAELSTLKRWQWSVFFVALFGYVGYYLCRKNISAAFPLLSEEFGYSNAELGLIALYSEIAYAIGKLINGPMADKVGGKKIFLLGMMGAIACNIIFSLGSQLWFFILTWCVCRYFLSMGWGGLIKMIGNWYPPEKNGTVMGFISLNFQFGGVVATLFAGLLVSLGVGWQGVFTYPALVLGLIMILSYLFSKESPKDINPATQFGNYPVRSKLEEKSEGDNHPIHNIKLLLKKPIFLHILLFSFLTTFLRSIFFFWTPKLLVDLGMGTSNAILKSALFPLLGCLGTIFIGWYTDNHQPNRAKIMAIMLIFLVIDLVLLTFFMDSLRNEVLIVALLGGAGFFLLGPYSMSSGALILDIAGPRAAGSGTGMIDGVGYLGGALSVWLAGVLSDMMGWKQVIWLLAFFALLSFISAYMMNLDYKKIKTKRPVKS